MGDLNGNWPPGASVMGELIREKNWSLTPLKAIPKWKPALKIAVCRVLDSHVASIVLWGDDLHQIYNDAYLPLLGPRHPGALGQPTAECWSEVWSFNEPIYKRVMGSGEVVHFEDQEFNIDPTGKMQSHYFTITYLPARDDEGTVCGVIVEVIETTNSVRLARENASFEKAASADKRRQSFSLALSDTLRACTTPDSIIAEGSKLLGKELGVARVLYCEVEEASATFKVRHDWAHDGVLGISGQSGSLSEYGDELIGVLRSGQVLVISDITSDKRAASVHAAYASLGVNAFIAIPLTKCGKLNVVLTAHRMEPHSWEAEELLLCQDCVERTWAAAENAKAQAELLRERDESASVFASMAEGFGLVDRDWTVLRMNEPGFAISARTCEEVIGKNHWDIWPESKGTPLAQLYDEVKTTGTPGSFEYLHEFANGATTWVEARAYRTGNDGLAFFFRDIGERKLAEERLMEAGRRKDEFLAMLAHELRNPLAPISSAASLLLLVKHDEQRVKRASEIISRQVRHMSSLIDDLLDVSRVTRGLIELDRAVIDAKRIVADAVEQVRPLLEARHQHLALNISSESTFVSGDHKRLVQVLANLLSNAVKYTPEEGNILVTTAVSDECIVISVVDDGIGMTKSLLSGAFDLFTQESRSSDRAQGGLGIGLALVKSLVDLHGGQVTGVSDGLGTGSRFEVRLPRVSATETRSEDAETVHAAATASLRILVVDDNVDACNTLSMLLTESGHDVSSAVNGKDALHIASSQAFDICVLDIGLPDMTGNELARQLRLHESCKSATLIALTGYGQEQDLRDSKAAGFDHHLVKPVDAALLVTILKSTEVVSR